MKLEIQWLQVARRIVQLGVVVMMLTVPAMARYHNYVAAREIDRALEKQEGTLPGHTLAAIDTVMRSLPDGEIERAGTYQRNRKQVLSYAQQLRGSVWSAEIAGVSLTDPLAAAESVVASRRFPWVLAVSVAIPLVVTILLGRVFCSWICPVGFLLELTDKLRNGLRFLEVHPRNLRAARGTKYALLVVGLVLSAIVAAPVLGYVYPPAAASREIHDIVFTAFDRAELGRTGFSLEGASWMLFLLAAIVAIELAVSRRWWCRYVCPGGALYSLLGRARPVRVELRVDKCTECAQCVTACPMGLNPMRDEMGMECDNCGSCISSCNDDALAYGLRLGTRTTPAAAQAPQHERSMT